MLLPKGILIAIDGIDGAGKTTQARRVASELRRVGLEVVESKEPTDGPHGRRIRVSARSGRMSPEDELKAFLDDRRQHVEELILPALAAGRVVIVDRYYPSTVAYQGIRGMNPAWLLEINESFAPRPDILVLLDVPAELGLQRVERRDTTGNLFEQLQDLNAAGKIFRSLSGPHVLRLNGLLEEVEITSAILSRVNLELVKRLCIKGKRECEPAFCAFQQTCPFLKTRLEEREMPEILTKVAAIVAGDGNDSAKLRHILELAKTIGV